MADNGVYISSSISTDLASVDAAIQSRNWLFSFPGKLEAVFERDTGEERCRDLIVRAYIGIVVYDLFAIADYWATPKLFWTAFWVRAAFFTPVALIMTAILHTRPRAFVRESLICFGGGAISVATIIFLMAASGDAPQATLHEIDDPRRSFSLGRAKNAIFVPGADMPRHHRGAYSRRRAFLSLCDGTAGRDQHGVQRVGDFRAYRLLHDGA